MVLLEFLGILSLSLLSSVNDDGPVLPKRPAWTRLIRFIDEDDIERYGEPIVDSGDHVIPEYEAGRLEAIVITGDKPLEGGERDKTAFVKELLSPLSPRNVTLVRHIATQSNDPDREGKPFDGLEDRPQTWIQGPATVSQWNDDIPVPAFAQDYALDAEDTLCFVVSKTAKNVPVESALECIGGFCVGARFWHRKLNQDGSSTCFKGFDKYTSLGPVLVSPSAMGHTDDFHRVRQDMRVGGELQRTAEIAHLYREAPRQLSWLSRGTTVEAGTVVIMGTLVPTGVQSNSLRLHHDSEVVVHATGLGYVKNKVAFDTQVIPPAAVRPTKVDAAPIKESVTQGPRMTQ